METDDYDFFTAGAEGQDAGPSLDDMMDLNIRMNQINLQAEEDIYTAHNEMPQPSAPLDIAKIKIKVDWTEQFPERWKAKLHKALQSWLSKLEGTVSVHSIKLMEDPSFAEVQITPATSLEVLKQHTSTSLMFKDIDKEVAAWIFLDDTHSVTVSLLEENRALSSKMNSSMPVTYAEANKLEDVAASNRASNETETIKTAEMTPEMSDTFTLPVHLSMYMHHAYSKEMEQIQKQHGVSFFAEVSVSFKPILNSSPYSVSKASVDFQNLVQKCVYSFSDATINHNDMDSNIVKETLRTIQSDKEKIMFTMSASNCMFFGPNELMDIIKRETTKQESQLSPMDVDNNFSPQSKSFLDTDTKDLPTQLEIDRIYWDLMKLSYKEQLSELETKYGVSFHEEKLHNNLAIKVQARSKVDQHIKLESHALRALTQLYQKLASAAVSCELKNPTDKTAVAPLVENLQKQHYCVVAADIFSPWSLVGLPEHLGPAIADIEKKLQKNVFDDKMKKLIGYSGDIPHTKGIKWNQTPDYGPGAVGGKI